MRGNGSNRFENFQDRSEFAWETVWASPTVTKVSVRPNRSIPCCHLENYPRMHPPTRTGGTWMNQTWGGTGAQAADAVGWDGSAGSANQFARKLINCLRFRDIGVVVTVVRLSSQPQRSMFGRRHPGAFPFLRVNERHALHRE